MTLSDHPYLSSSAVKPALMVFVSTASILVTFLLLDIRVALLTTQSNDQPLKPNVQLDKCQLSEELSDALRHSQCVANKCERSVWYTSDGRTNSIVSYRHCGRRQLHLHRGP